jgi:sugar phosphate isomerase/epimerase
MAKRTVGVQTIIFGKRSQDDLAGVLDEVAAAGYRAVETSFWRSRGLAGRELKKMLDDRGLVHVGAHFAGDKLHEIDAVIDWLKETGGTDAPISDLELRDAVGLELYHRKAAAYNAAGEKCRKAGLTLSYHNHSWEFRRAGDVLPIEVLYAETDPANVMACVDTYWVWDGGHDPAAFVKKHGGRIRILHCKDSYLQERGRRSFAPVGSGALDFPAIFKALDRSPCPWVVVEQDVPNPGQDARGCINASRTYLRDTLGL